MRIAIIGAGRVGKPLGAALKAKGHSVVYGVRDPQASAGIITKTVGGAIAGTDVVILATPWTVAEALVCEHAPGLADKIVIDATNPLNTNATRLALGFDTSGAELLQSQAQRATFFKALNVARLNAIAKPRYPQGAAAGFVAGPSGSKKDIVLGLVADIGFEPVDAGDLRAARLLEPLAMLRLQLEDTWGKGRDFAFVLGARDLEQIKPAQACTVVGLNDRTAGPEPESESPSTVSTGSHSGPPDEGFSDATQEMRTDRRVYLAR